MRLIELNPRIAGRSINFDCPKCKTHRVMLPLVGNTNAKRTWSIYNEDDMNKVELRPSIREECCHFTVNNGEVRLV